MDKSKENFDCKREREKFRRLRQLSIDLLNNQSLTSIEFAKFELPKASPRDRLTTVSSSISIEAELRLAEFSDPKRVKSKYIIKFDNIYLRLFNEFMVLVAWFSVTSTLCYLAFDDFPSEIHVTDNAIWCLFMVHLILKTFTEYKDSNRRIISNRKLIIKNYLRKGLVFDLLPLLSLHWAGLYTAEYFLRLIRIKMIMRSIKKIDNKSLSKKLVNYFHPNDGIEKVKGKHIIKYILEILRNIIITTFGTFVFACLWLYYTKKIFETNTHSPGFIKNFNLKSQDNGSVVVKCWYFIFTTLATVGYGDFLAINKDEMIVIIILLLFGTAWFSYIMSCSIHFINKFNDLTGANKKLIEVKKWTKSLESNFGTIDKKLKSDIINHFQYLYHHEKVKEFMTIPQEQDLDISKFNQCFYDQLPEQLTKEILKAICSDFIYHYYYFFRPFKSYKYKLAYFSQPRLFQKDSFLLKENDIPYEIVLVNSGYVSIGITLNDTWHEIANIRNNFVVGEYTLYKNLKSFTGFQAKTAVRAYAIPFYVVNEFIIKYNIDLKKYINRIQKNYSVLLKKVKQISEIECDNSSFLKRFECRKESHRQVVFKNNILRKIQENQSKNENELNRAIEEVEGKIKDFFEMRNRIYKDIKEKAAEFIKNKK